MMDTLKIASGLALCLGGLSSEAGESQNEMKTKKKKAMVDNKKVSIQERIGFTTSFLILLPFSRSLLLRVPPPPQSSSAAPPN